MKTLEDYYEKFQIDKLLDLVPSGESHYEFETFVVSQQLGKARQVRKVLEELKSDGNKFGIIDAKSKSDILLRYEWLDKQGDLEEILSKFEEEEPDYWAATIGTEAALDILSRNQMSKAVLKKLISLPRDDFYTAVTIATKIATKVREMTIDAESILSGEKVE